MTALKSYRDLQAWQSAMDLCETIYRLTACFPDGERYGLIAQMRRAVTSVPANIAEGYGRSHRGDYLHHLSIAMGSLAEVETFLILAVRLGFASRESSAPIWEQLTATGKLLRNLQLSLKKPKVQTLDPRP